MHTTRFIEFIAVLATLQGLSAPVPVKFGDISATNLVYDASGVDELIGEVVTKGVEVPESAADRGVTFVNQYNENENASVSIGNNARAGIVAEDLLSAPSNQVVRSGCVAIGDNATVFSPSDKYKQQGTAIGWNATAIGLNATAIGSGAVHTNKVPAESAEDPNSGAGNTLAKGAKSVAIGYGAKAVGTNAIQLGEGVNTEDDSLKFNNLTIAKGGKLNFSASDLSSAAKTAVSEMTGNRLTTLTQTIPTPTNGWAGVTVSSYDDGDGSDHLFSIMVNTNAAYSTTSITIHGTRVDIYKKETVDSIVSNLVERIAALESRVTTLEGKVQ